MSTLFSGAMGGVHHDGPMHPPTIVPMETNSIRRIVAGQAVTDLASAVKELVDNALDAGATSINIRLWDSGTKILEVSDDGSGVPVESRPYIALKNATSKIRNFEDIYAGGNTLGFRGEALFCLANISQQLLVGTRTATDELGQRLRFGRDGYLDPESVCQTPRKVGTTVAVVGLFDALPVRKADMIKRIKKQRAKLMKMMQGYAVLCTGVRFNLMDIVGADNREHTILATSAGNTTLLQTVSSALGSRFQSTLTQFSLDLTSAIDGENTTDSQWKVEGLISKAPNLTGKNGSASRELQFFSINNRPVELPRVSRALSDAWRVVEGSNTKRPACALCFTLPSNAYDVNLSPDKREVFLRDEAAICELIREAAAALWSSHVDGTFAANEVEMLSQSRQSKPNVPVAAAVPQSQPEPPQETGMRRRARRRMGFVHSLDNACMQHEGGERMEAMQGTIRQQDYGINEASEYPAIAAIGSKELSNSSDAMQPTEASGTVEQPEERPPLRVSDRDRIKWSQTQLQFNKVSSDSLSQQEEIQMLEEPTNESQVASRDTSSIRKRSRSEQETAVPRAVSLELSNNSRADGQSDTNKRLSLKEFAFAPVGDKVPLKRKAASNMTASRPRKESRTCLKNTPMSRSSGLSRKGNSRNIVTPDESQDQKDGRNAAVLVEQAADKQMESSETIDKEVAMECSGAESSSDEDSPMKPRKLQRRGSNTEKKERVVWQTFQGTQQIVQAARAARQAMQEQRRNLQKNIKKQSSLTAESNGIEQVQGNGMVSLTKSDFKEMSVIGQFNLGFILARCRNNHLWILDQHACDEKYNFERLCAKTVIHEQKLICPMPLELSHSEESCILDHMQVFEKNGFRFCHDPDKPPRHRLALTSLPHSGAPDGQKAVQFGKEDVTALCAMLNADEGESDGRGGGYGTGADGSGIYGNNAVRRYAGGVLQVNKSDNETDEAKRARKIITRLPKAIAMFANRACRGSIMIGTALSNKEMDAIVKRLADVDNPWNCPHGRPTMRHVRDLAPTLLEEEKKAEVHVAGPTLAALSQYQEEETNHDDDEL